MNRRDFFKRAGAVVSAAILGRVAPAAPSLLNNDMTVTISNELTPVVSNTGPDWYVLTDDGWQPLYADVLKAHEFLAIDEQAI